MQPFRIVKMPTFKALVTGLSSLQGPIKSPAVDTIQTKMTELYHAKKNTLMSTFQRLSHKHISVTTDIWSSNHRSYLGVTVHWITENWERKSAALTLKRFAGRHTGERIAIYLRDIFASFSIQDQITMVITDNGSNFVKAFRSHGLVFSIDGENSDFEDEFTSDDEDDCSEDDLVTEDATEVLDEANLVFDLPRHARCASHTFSLIATTDLENELSKRIARSDRTKSTCKVIMRSMMAKCTAYWNRCSRSNLINESVQKEISRAPITPCKTRWNSVFDSIKQLIDYFEKLDKVFKLAGVAVLQSNEKEFLRAYNVAMEPIAWALDKLQGENNLFFGAICPAVFKCKLKLQEYVNSQNDYVAFIAKALLTGLSARFKKILDVDLETAYFEIMATCSMPVVKLAWIPEEKVDIVKSAFIEEAKNYNGNPSTQENDPTKNNMEDDLYAFESNLEENESAMICTEDAELECIRFFKDTDKTLHSLKNYPRVNKMFLRYNTALPSSAPAERMFSYGKMIKRPQRARLSDENFEKLLFLKLNVDL